MEPRRIMFRAKQSDRVYSVPDSGVVVSGGGDHDGGHDRGDIEGGPLEHEAIEQSLFGEVGIASFFHFVFDGDSSGVVDGVGLVAVVVGLDEEPG